MCDTSRRPRSAGVTISDVKAFWEASPLFVGEGRHVPGTREWFLEHERIYLEDCMAGAPPRIFTDGVASNARVLDVGCGPGFWVRYFSRLGFTNLHACDLTEAAVDLTRRSLEIFNMSAEVRIADAERLPYENGTFDHVNCQGVIHHTPDPAGALSEFSRVLRPSGTVCLSVYRRNFVLRHPAILRVIVAVIGKRVALRGRGRESMLGQVDPEELVRMYDGRDNPLGRAYTVTELREMLSGLFAIEAMEYFFFPARAFPIKIPGFLQRWLSRRFGLLIVVKARKLYQPA